MDTYRVVVGVDGSAGGARALRWAARASVEHGGVVRAVIAWSVEDPPGGPGSGPPRQRAGRILDEAVRAVTGEFPGLIIASEVADGPAPRALTRAAQGATLLVLGSDGTSRRRSGVGPVAEACIRAATCPVVVVPVIDRSA